MKKACIVIPDQIIWVTNKVINKMKLHNNFNNVQPFEIILLRLVQLDIEIPPQHILSQESILFQQNWKVSHAQALLR